MDLSYSATNSSARYQRRRVRILSTDVEKRTSQARDQQGGKLIVDLRATVGPVVVYPSQGEEWYVVNISDRWVLERRTDYQNAAYTVESKPGDWVIFNPTGKIRIQDKDGPVGSGGTAIFSDIIDRKIRVGTTVKVVEVIDAETGDLLGYIPILK